MSVEAVTNPDTGERFYRITEATPPRKMWSVTTILGCGSSKALIYHAGVQGVSRTLDLADEIAAPGYADWRDLRALCRQRFGVTKKGFIRPPHLLEWGKKADTGSAVHNAIEREIKLRLGLPAPAEYDVSGFTDAQKAGYAKACAAWDEWKLKAHFEPLASEEVVWVEGGQDCEWPAWDRGPMEEDESYRPLARYDYACRVDLAATILGERGIWDVKTGKMDKNGQPYDSMWLQVEAQRRAANARDLCGGGFTVAGIIHVPAAGGPVVVHSNALRDKDRDFQAFDHLNGYARLSVLGDPGVL